MKQWKKRLIILLITAILLLGGGFYYNESENVRIALVDIDYDTKLKPHKNEIIKEANKAKKEYGISKPQFITMVWRNSKIDIADIKNLKGREDLYKFVRLEYDFLNQTGIKNDITAKNYESSKINDFIFATLRVSEVLNRIDPIKYHSLNQNTYDGMQEIFNTITTLRKEYSKSDVIFILELFSNFREYFITNDRKFLAFVFSIENIISNKDAIIKDLDRLSDLIFESHKIQKGQNNSNISVAVILELNGINIGDFLQKDDVDKAIVLWNLSAKKVKI